MKTLGEHRQKLKEIVDYACGYGIKTIGIEPLKKGPPDTWGKETLTLFITKCHEGFKIAQKLLIEEVKYYQTLTREYTQNKTHRDGDC